MRDFLCAIVFLIGTVLLVGGCLFYGNLFGASGAAIGFGTVLCVLAAIAKDQIDPHMTLFWSENILFSRAKIRRVYS